MTNATRTYAPLSRLDDLLDALAARIQAGDPSAVEAFLADHPDHADELRRMLPAMEVLMGLDASADPAAEAGSPLGELGDFRIVREVGRGGMGVVYEAVQISLSRRVALKVLPMAATMDPRQLTRFRHEAQAAAMLHHPHIVPVYGVGCERSVHYYAMQLIDGRSLADAIDEMRPVSRERERPESGPTPVAHAPGSPTAPVAAFTTRKSGPDRAHFRRVAELVAQAADALEFAHSMGVVHRDVKPANLMLDAGGNLWVTDFGLAKLDTAVGMTMSGDLLGTLRYMSPEQALARHGLVDHRTDVYSLGATLYELLTLRPAVDGEDRQEVLRRIAFEEPTAPRKCDRAIPVELETITLKALAKEPAQRYATAGELADDLRRWLESKPIKARRAGLLERAVYWCRRHPSVAALYVTLTTVALVAVAAAGAYQRQQFGQELARAEGERRARASALMDALETADIAGVPVVVRGLEQVRAEAVPLLRERHRAAVLGSAAARRYALALLPSDPQTVDELLAGLPTVRAEEVVVLRDALQPYAARVTALWPQLDGADARMRLPLATLLAGFVPPDERWRPHAAALVDQLVRLNPLELAAWSAALDRLRPPLTPALIETYRAAQDRLRGEGLTAPELVAEAGRLDAAAALLTRAAAERTDVLVELLQTADAHHYAAFLRLARGHREVVAAAMRSTLDRPPAGPAKDDALAALAARQSRAAITLLQLGEPGPAWELLRHRPDPTVRSYLIEDLATSEADPLVLARRYAVEQDASARRALLLSLGGYDPANIPAAERDGLTGRLIDDFRQGTDAGLHGAIDWLLRQKWGRDAELDRIVGGLRGQPAGDRDWFVNTQGQTFTVVRGPVEFHMGSPPDEPGREGGEVEALHREPINRSFAIATREVTVAEYRRFRKDYVYRDLYAPNANGPINDTSWFEAAAYCRWLSEQEGVPEDQMCYPRLDAIKPGVRLPADLASRTGYRLPTEAEWEYACRAGAVTARPYGRGTELLGRYAWYLKNSQDRLGSGGRLKPNDLGLFDVLGNAWEWCQDEYAARPIASDDRRETPPAEARRILRGSSFINLPLETRCAFRYWPMSGHRHYAVSFRPARTLR